MAGSNPLLTWFRGLRRGEEPEEAQEPMPEPPEEVRQPPTPAGDHLQMDLPPDHAVYKLHALRREQAGSLPRPRFSFHIDEKTQLLPESAASRELARLKLSVNASANARLKEAQPPPAAKPLGSKPPAAKPSEGRQPEGEPPEDEPPEEPPAPELDAMVVAFVATDAMSAWVYAYPPVGAGRELDADMVRGALREAKVTFGIDAELCSELPAIEERYFHLFPVARGRQTVFGEDGRIIDLFSRSTERKIKVDEFNRVDYAAISVVQNVEEGETICRIIPPIRAEPGCTVLGRKLPARDGIPATVPKGRNTALSEDGTALIATKTGHVEFCNRTFQVRPILDIAGNVDYSTGNINFLGDVHVHGDVCTGFVVRAMGTITVDGVVEPCTVEAGNDLIIVKGAQGDGRAVLRASHSIYAKFLESCCVYAVESLHSDCLINCDVCCDGTVEVNTGRGTVIGGNIRCAHEVNALAMGSRAEIPTEVVLGGLPCQGFDQEVLLMEIADLESELEAVEQQPDSPTKFTRTGKLRMQISVDKKKLEQLRESLEDPAEKSDEEPGVRRLSCGVAYPGVSVTIGSGNYRFQRETRPVNAYLNGSGEIEIT